MAKDLPKMYQNKIDKNFDNVQKVYSSLYNHTSTINERSNKEDIKNIYSIEQKIHNIFKSPTYIYKADVVIETDDEIINKRIIGKSKNNLITIDNEHIPISKIKDIYTK